MLLEDGGTSVLYEISSRLWQKFADCLVSLLDLDILLLAGDLEGFGSLLGALGAGGGNCAVPIST